MIIKALRSKKKVTFSKASIEAASVERVKIPTATTKVSSIKPAKLTQKAPTEKCARSVRFINQFPNASNQLTKNIQQALNSLFHYV